MVHKRRFPKLFPTPFECVGVGSLGIPEVGNVEGTVGIEALGKSQGDDTSPFTPHLDAQPACHVLPHIQNKGIRSTVDDGDGLTGTDHLHVVVELCPTSGLLECQVTMRGLGFVFLGQAVGKIATIGTGI